MIDFLSQAKKPSETPTSPMLVVVGSPGSGKSSFAGVFPNPIFIQAETAGTVFESWDSSVQPTLLPELPQPAKDAAGNVINSAFDTVRAQLGQLMTAEHDFETVVIDSVTAINRKFEQEILLKYKVTAVGDAAGGFYKGFQELMGMHSSLIYWCDQLRKKRNISIVFLAHTDIQKIKLSPDEGSEYSVYSMQMPKDSANQYINNADATMFIKNEQFVTGQETNRKGQTTKYGRVMQTGNRILITSGDGRQGYIDAKNRYAMPAEIDLPMGENPITQYIPFFNKGE